MASVKVDVEAELQRSGEQLTEAKRKFIIENADLSHVPSELKQNRGLLYLERHGCTTPNLSHSATARWSSSRWASGTLNCWT